MQRAEIIQFIQDNLLQGGETIGPDDSLIDLGVLDSLGLIRIMQFVEARAGVKVPDHMVTPDNFQSVTALEQLLASLRPGAAPPA